MTKKEKYALVEELKGDFTNFSGFYLVNIQGFSAEKNNNFRRKCFEKNLKVRSVKNSLLIKAMDALDDDYSEIYPALVESTSLIFIPDAAKEPAKVIKDFEEGAEGTMLKAAYIEGSTYLGGQYLDALTKVKSKADLIADVVALLQSPAKNVISALQSPAQKISGVLQTLAEREG